MTLSPTSSRGSSSSAAGMTQICDSLLVGTQASFDTNTILGGVLPTTYSHLLLLVGGRTDEVAQNSSLKVRFNNDSGNNYDSEWFVGTGASTASTTGSAGGNGGDLAVIAAASATAAKSGYAAITIFNYRDTNLKKVATFGLFADFSAQWSNAGGFQWNSAAAITRVQVVINGAANFVAGSRFTLYGLT